MKVFIYACEGQYQGLHGMYEQGFYDVESVEEIDDIGNEMAEDVIVLYGLIDNYDDAEEGCDPWECYMEFYGKEWSAWKVREDLNLTDEDLERISRTEDYETIIEDYCEKEALI